MTYSRLGLACALGFGCDASPSASIPREMAVHPGDGTLATRLSVSGVEIEAIDVGPRPIDPARDVDVQLTAVGPRVVGLRAAIELWPGRPGSRQVALGGVDAPPLAVAIDPRVQRVEVALVEGPQSIVLPPLPEAWFARTAIVRMAVYEGRGQPEPWLGGPVTPDGWAVLDVLPVAVRPPLLAAGSGEVIVDGVLDEAVWRSPARVLVDSLEGEPTVLPDTRVRFACGRDALALAVDIPDADVWSDLQQQDDPLWNEEVVELFVFSPAGAAGRYLELQISPRGVRFDARFAGHRRGDPSWNGPWQGAVVVDGTLDDRRDRDRGWTAELAVPWTEICAHTDTPCPDGRPAQVRVNVFRFERPREGPPVALALSPTRVPDFHTADAAATVRCSG